MRDYGPYLPGMPYTQIKSDDGTGAASENVRGLIGKFGQRAVGVFAVYFHAVCFGSIGGIAAGMTATIVSEDGIRVSQDGRR
ncbi:hypothetical protein PACILC2_08830 [Paenibacillus cisolokensis]|uniref:Uncharacterized protein n=1 Tax=Paenibacillus cisolokensis TaxID=1658519 RepID=A0ABQ4N2B6_9BACL|nr:hypothetical protein PACILC2_08830 [Paenibacillus cisolokensis]